MRRRYRFLGREGQDTYVWESVLRLPGDSRVEQIRCNVHWFWHPVTQLQTLKKEQQ